MQRTKKISLLMIMGLNIFLIACIGLAAVENEVEALIEEVETALPEEIQPTETVEPEPISAPAIILSDQIVQERSEEPAYEIDLIYPYLEGQQVIAEPFNAEMEYLIEVVLEVFLQDVAERDEQRGDDAMPATSTLEIDYTATYQTYPLVSVHMPITTYLAISPSPGMNSFSYNFNAASGEFVFLDDLFLAEADHQQAILEAVEETLIDRDFGYQPGTAADVLQRRPNWNITPEGLQINFDAYEVGPGAAGPQVVLIPWEVLSIYLDPAGPVQYILDPAGE